MKMLYCSSCGKEMLCANTKVQKEYRSPLWNSIYKQLKLANVSLTLKDSVDARTLDNYICSLATVIETGINEGSIRSK